MAGNGQIHCLATDSHHPGWHNPAGMQAATAKLRALIGQENLQRITTDNPLRVLSGEVLQPMTKYPGNERDEARSAGGDFGKIN